MINIFLAIASSTIILVLFKIFPLFNVNIYQSIVINYFTASILGFINKNFLYNLISIETYSWWQLAFIIGVLLLFTFLLVQYATRKIGMSITSVACKMSVVIPVVFSIIYDKEKITVMKIIIILLAIVSIFLLLQLNNENKNTIKSLYMILLPIFLFLGLGFSDSMIKYTQTKYISSNDFSFFTSILFFFSFLSSIILGWFKKQFIKGFYSYTTIIGGVLLGLSNYGSVYFLLQALSKSGLESSLVFGFVNLGIILCSVLIAFIIFKERLSKRNRVGLITAMITIILMIVNGQF